MGTTIQNIGVLNAAIVEAMEGNSHFYGWTIERGMFLNEEPNNCPWAGVYRREVRYEPGTLGKNNPQAWDGLVQSSIVLQRSGVDGQEVEDELEADIQILLQEVLDADFIKQYIDRVLLVEVTYTYENEDADSFHFQSAIIDITMEAANG